MLAAVTFLFLLNAFIQSGYIYPAEVIVGLCWLAVCYLLSARCSVPFVLTLTFLGCVAWGLFLASQPVSDWYYLHLYAKNLIQEGEFQAPFVSKSFTTVAYGSVFHLLLGSGWVTNYIASALAWTIGSAFVYRAVLPFANDKRLARFICFALALCPTFLVFSPVLGTKGVFYLISAICAWLVSRHLCNRERRRWIYVSLGLALGLLFLTRPHGVLLFAVCVPIVAVMGTSLREPPPPPMNRLTPTVIVLVAFTLVLLAHACLSYVNNQGFQVLTQRTAWINLLYGTNVEAGGMHSLKDQRKVVQADRGGDNPADEVNRRAREMAFERVTSDIPGFIKFAFTTKMKGLYGRDSKLFRRAYGNSDRAAMLKQYVQPAAERVEMGVYRLVFLLFLVLLAREIWRPSRLLILGIIVLLYSLPHLLIEVDQRHHMLMLPYFVVGAALLVYEVVSKRDHQQLLS